MLFQNKDILIVIKSSHSQNLWLTWTGGSQGGRGDPLEENLMIFSQSLLGQVALPLDLHLQRLWHIRYDPFDRSQHKKNYVLGMEKDKDKKRLNITASWKSVHISQAHLNHCNKHSTHYDI